MGKVMCQRRGAVCERVLRFCSYVALLLGLQMKKSHYNFTATQPWADGSSGGVPYETGSHLRLLHGTCV